MTLVGKQKLREFAQLHADVRGPLNAWEREVVAAQWTSPQAVKDRYQHASLISGSRVIFNIKGGRYRLQVRVDYELQVVIVQRIGTHEEYNGWEL